MAETRRKPKVGEVGYELFALRSCRGESELPGGVGWLTFRPSRPNTAVGVRDCWPKTTELNPQPLTDAAIVPANPLGAVSPEGTPTVEPCAPALYRENIGLAEKSAPTMQPNRMILRFPPLTTRIVRYLFLGGVGYETFRPPGLPREVGYETFRPPELLGGVGYETFCPLALLGEVGYETFRPLALPGGSRSCRGE